MINRKFVHRISFLKYVNSVDPSYVFPLNPICVCYFVNQEKPVIYMYAYTCTYINQFHLHKVLLAKSYKYTLF